MTNLSDSEILTRVGPGTPMGNLMRHYWLPALKSSELKADGDPVRLMLLGEKLVAFREKASTHAKEIQKVHGEVDRLQLELMAEVDEINALVAETNGALDEIELESEDFEEASVHSAIAARTLSSRLTSAASRFSCCDRPAMPYS